MDGVRRLIFTFLLGANRPYVQGPLTVLGFRVCKFVPIDKKKWEVHNSNLKQLSRTQAGPPFLNSLFAACEESGCRNRGNQRRRDVVLGLWLGDEGKPIKIEAIEWL